MILGSQAEVETAFWKIVRVQAEWRGLHLRPAGYGSGLLTCRVISGVYYSVMSPFSRMIFLEFGVEPQQLRVSTNDQLK